MALCRNPITLEFDYEIGARPRAVAPDVDRLLEDQLDSHLFPGRTGMGSRSFRLRAAHTGDGDRRFAG